MLQNYKTVGDPCLFFFSRWQPKSRTSWANELRDLFRLLINGIICTKAGHTSNAFHIRGKMLTKSRKCLLLIMSRGEDLYQSIETQLMIMLLCFWSIYLKDMSIMPLVLVSGSLSHILTDCWEQLLVSCSTPGRIIVPKEWLSEQHSLIMELECWKKVYFSI